MSGNLRGMSENPGSVFDRIDVRAQLVARDAGQALNIENPGCRNAARPLPLGDGWGLDPEQLRERLLGFGVVNRALKRFCLGVHSFIIRTNLTSVNRTILTNDLALLGNA